MESSSTGFFKQHLVLGFNVQRFRGWKTAAISHQMLAEIEQQPKIGHLNSKTSQPRTLNFEPKK
jgi:hypothetical protein